MPFLSGLFPDVLLEQIAQARARFVQLRFRIAHGASHDVRYLVMLVTLDIVQNENRPVARRQLFHRALQINPVNRSAQAQIRGANIFPGATGVLIGLRGFFQRSHRERLLSQAHQDNVNGHPVQPGRESRFAAERADFAEQLQERFLHQIFRVRWVIYHAQAKGVDAAAVESIQKLKSLRISGLCQTNGFGFRHPFGRSGTSRRP
jgi:hypothetical protein